MRAFADSIAGLDKADQQAKLVETGYAMPHWPAPWGRDTGAIEQLVIQQEFERAGIERPALGITAWVILTLIQHATDDQVARWVRPAVNQDVIWCRLFSEPDAGSDAAGIKTRGMCVDGGWLVNGQKVWTSHAHVAKRGLATVRTNPDVPKHNGITMMVIDMEAAGVEVRPLKMVTGTSDFNEVFFDDVFVPDDNVVGPVDGGWTVARATLGNESVSIGGGSGAMTMSGDALIPLFDAHPERLSGGSSGIGRTSPTTRRSPCSTCERPPRRGRRRARAGGQHHQAGAVGDRPRGGGDRRRAERARPGFMDGQRAMAGLLVLCHRGCRSPAARRRSSATRSVSASSVSHVIPW